VWRAHWEPGFDHEVAMLTWPFGKAQTSASM
jgi:hypothetical protein